MGAAQVSSPNHQGITETVVPVSSLVAFLLLAALLGLISASWRPAPESPSRATRPDFSSKRVSSVRSELVHLVAQAATGAGVTVGE
jgi:hypothetical protein